MPLILGIETSCDETAASVVKDGREVLSNSVASQIAKHSAYGGVIPELAAREHLTAIETVVEKALNDANISASDLDAVAVTHAPGLVPALLIGINFAKGLSLANSIPLIGINHFLAHIYGTFVDDPERRFDDPTLFPMMAMVVSGGHTSIVIITADGKAKLAGTTLDDAAGEAFDKAAKLLDLGYPGGPIIEKLAGNGNPERFRFPRSLTGTAGKAVAPENRFNFSFSGLKTALLYHTKNFTAESGPLEGQDLYDTLASYQEAIVDVLCAKAFDAAQFYRVKSAVLCGGVACNGALRKRFEEVAPKGLNVLMAPKKYCTDNGVMVAGLADMFYRNGEFSPLDIDSHARLPLDITIPFPWNKT